MEITNGRIQKASRRNKKQALDMGSTHSYRGTWYPWLILVCTLSIAGCSLPKIKTALMTGAATTAAVGVTSALVPGALVPAVVGGTTAVIVRGEPISVTADTVVQEAPANFFTLLQQLVEMGGWLLILIFVVPMVLGWILPGPLERKKKS